MIERGRAIEWGWIQVGCDRGIGITVSVDKQEVIACLKADAQAELPNGTRFELRQRMPTNYGRTNGIAWYANDQMPLDEEWGKGTFPRSADGYVLIGQFTTEASPLTNATAPREM